MSNKDAENRSDAGEGKKFEDESTEKEPAVDCGQRRRRRCAGPSKTSPVGRRSTASSSAAFAEDRRWETKWWESRGITVASACYELVSGAGYRVRTDDIQLGKLTLYQLS